MSGVVHAGRPYARAARIGREAWSPSIARASAPPIAEPPMPATTRPPGRVPRLQVAPTRPSTARRAGARAGRRCRRACRRRRPRRSSRASSRQVGRSQKARPPSGTSMPGNSRAPRAIDVVGADRDALAEHRAADDLACGRRCRAPGATMQSRRTQSRADLARRRARRALDDRAGADVHAVAEHREAADVRAARRSCAPRSDDRGRHDAALDAAPTDRPRGSRRRAGLRPPCARCPRGCRTSPAGSAPACRCRSSRRRRRRSRRGRGRRARGQTSRSIETLRSGGIMSSTERSST